jgi:hypothetical protein
MVPYQNLPEKLLDRFMRQRTREHVNLQPSFKDKIRGTVSCSRGNVTGDVKSRGQTLSVHGLKSQLPQHLDMGGGPAQGPQKEHICHHGHAEA